MSSAATQSVLQRSLPKGAPPHADELTLARCFSTADGSSEVSRTSSVSSYARLPKDPTYVTSIERAIPAAPPAPPSEHVCALATMLLVRGPTPQAPGGAGCPRPTSGPSARGATDRGSGPPGHTSPMSGPFGALERELGDRRAPVCQPLAFKIAMTSMAGVIVSTVLPLNFCWYM